MYVQTHFAARIIQDILRRDTYPARKSPAAIEYPLNVTQIIIANLPHVWSIKDETNSISGDGFEFNSSVDYTFIWVPYFLRSEGVKMTFNKTWKKLRTEVANGSVLQKEESNTEGHYQS